MTTGNKAEGTAIRPGIRVVLAIAIGIGLGVLGMLLVSPRPTAPGPRDPEPPRGLAVADDPTESPLPASREVALLAGPWGRLRVLSFWLKPRSEFVDTSQCPTDNPPWEFPGLSPEGLESLLRQSGADETTRQQLRASARFQDGTCLLRPGPYVIMHLAPPVRAAFYRRLLEVPESPWQEWTIRLDPSDLQDWVDRSGLPEPAREAMHRLAYPLGDKVAISDLPLLCGKAVTTEERRQLVGAWSTNRALMVKLQLQPGDDVFSIASYWSGGALRKEILPMLESLAALPQGVVVDILHLLPASTRSLLNRFPAPGDPPRNCFWTAFNFGKDFRDDSLLDARKVQESLDRHYREVVNEAPGLGDLVLLTGRSGNVVHAAVQIADGIVFTKNGESLMQPWVLMWLRDVQSIYGKAGETGLRYFRWAAVRAPR